MMPRLVVARCRRVHPLLHRFLPFAAVAVLACMPACARAADPVAAGSDPSALALADSVMQGLGGKAAWDKAKYIAFDFVVSRHDTTLNRRSLRWDRATDRMRIEGKDGKGRTYVILTDMAHKSGVTKLDGAPADSATHAALLERAYQIWVNDTYWMLMPYKLRDPGVHLADAGVDATGRLRVLALSFDKVGLTPGDRYWVYIDPKTHLVSRWEMLLQSNKDGVKTVVGWTDWHEYDGIQLAGRRPFEDGSIEIRMENITVAPAPPAGAFDS